MYAPSQAHRARGAAGDPLPVVWKALGDAGIKLRRGQFGLVAAGPGTGKSAFTLNYAIRAAVPTLYFSADSDSYTQEARMLSVATGRTMADSERIVRGDDRGYHQVFEPLPIRWSFDASPTTDVLDEEVSAFREVFGDCPDLIIVDNISNVRAEILEESATAGLDAVAEHLHTMARETGSCVLGLHHVTAAYNDGDKGIPLSGVKSQVTDKPELVLTLAKKPADEWSPVDTLMVAPVKNRAGKADPSGKTFARLAFDGERMQIGDFER